MPYIDPLNLLGVFWGSILSRKMFKLRYPKEQKKGQSFFANYLKMILGNFDIKTLLRWFYLAEYGKGLN